MQAYVRSSLVTISLVLLALPKSACGRRRVVNWAIRPWGYCVSYYKTLFFSTLNTKISLCLLLIFLEQTMKVGLGDIYIVCKTCIIFPDFWTNTRQGKQKMGKVILIGVGSEGYVPTPKMGGPVVICPLMEELKRSEENNIFPFNLRSSIPLEYLSEGKPEKFQPHLFFGEGYGSGRSSERHRRKHRPSDKRFKGIRKTGHRR